jgi:hypothetical protein
MGLISHSKDFLTMHSPMTTVVPEIMREIILNQTGFVNILPKLRKRDRFGKP